MDQPKAFGTFVKRGDHIYRTSAYIQWGDSEKSIGACLLLNPGSATLHDELAYLLDTEGSASGWIKSEDPTMEQLIQFIERIYGTHLTVSGRLHIYNLFNLQNTKSINAIDQFEELVESGQYDRAESLVAPEELSAHPWLLLGWGVKVEKRWKNYRSLKEQWLKVITDSKVATFGKKHERREDYYHPCPLIPTQRPTMVEELVAIYRRKFAVQRFPVYSTKPNLIVINQEPVEYVGFELDYQDGWHRSFDNPETIVKGFHTFGLKMAIN